MAELVLAVDIAGDRNSTAVVDRDGKMLVRRSAPLDRTSVAAAVKELAHIASDLCPPRTRYAAVGISAAGMVRDGIVSLGEAPGWDKVPLARLLQARLQVPVVVERNTNAAALGEAWHGAGRGRSDVVVLCAGATVGAGIIAGGRLLRGAHHLAGAAGWMAITEADSLEVRKFGGVEAFASELAILRAASNYVKAGVSGALAESDSASFSMEDIAELARRGDVACRQIFHRAGKLLGLASANLINLFDPEVVVFNGSLASVADLFWDELTHTAQSRCHPAAARRVKIRVSGLGEDAFLHGAALVAWQATDAAASDLSPGLPKAKKKPASSLVNALTT